jgi:hypothetical protein
LRAALAARVSEAYGAAEEEESEAGCLEKVLAEVSNRTGAFVE